MVLNLAGIVAPPRAQEPTAIGQHLPDDGRAAEEYTDLELLIAPAPGVLVYQDRLVLEHLLVVRVEDAGKVRPAEQRRVNEPRERALGVLGRAVHLEEPAVDVGRDVLALLRDVRGDPDVEVVGAVVLRVPLLAAADLVQQV